MAGVTNGGSPLLPAAHGKDGRWCDSLQDSRISSLPALGARRSNRGKRAATKDPTPDYVTAHRLSCTSGAPAPLRSTTHNRPLKNILLMVPTSAQQRRVERGSRSAGGRWSGALG